MKNFVKYILIFIATAIVFCSCEDELTIPPVTILSSQQVFSSEGGILAYMVSLYATLPMEDFNFSNDATANPWSGRTAFCSGEALTCQFDMVSTIGDGTFWDLWDPSSSANSWFVLPNAWPQIREANNFIANINSANIPSSEKQSYLGEAMFIRGYDYFALVKRYGGVPIIKNVQTYSGSIGPLQVPRNTEQEVYDYIGTQLDSAALLLPATSERGRANKYVALALKSRVMLYAGSEAKYGSVQLNGLVGIPASAASQYFKASFDAANSIINSGSSYALYNKYADPVQNYTNLFLDNDPKSNKEIMLERDYVYPIFYNHWNCWNLPYGVRGPDGYGSRFDPTLEMVEDFESIDGTPGTLQVTDASGNPIEYKNPADIYKNKDPRCLASIIMPFSTWEGTTIGVQAGIIDDDAVTPTTTVYGRKTVTAGNYNQLYNINTHKIDPNGNKQIVSINGIWGSETSVTGFYIRKYLDYTIPQSQASYWGPMKQSWFDIRYAEVLLNYAEAAIEQGDVADAKYAVNLIRQRAGMQNLTDADVTIDRVRNERTVELAFESHHYWDIRRWHIADKQIMNKKFTALYPYYDLQNDAWMFTKVPVGYSYTFYSKLYYEKINPSQISADPKLVQNPLY
jgi:hypothetical protein